MIDFKDIKMICVDVDGVLSDGIYQITSSGEVIKSFYTRDFYILEQLMRHQIQVVIITQSHDEVILRQIKRICNHSEWWEHCFYQSEEYDNLLLLYQGSDDKLNTMIDCLKTNKLSWKNVAYMGDAENDLECMESARFTGCPVDAVRKVKYGVNYISDYKGGNGAVYDFGKYILEKINGK